MRCRRAWIAIACCAALACSRSEEKKASSEPPATRLVSPCDSSPLADHIKQHPAYVLAAAADVVPGAASICDSTFKDDWMTFEPRSLPDWTTPARLDAGIGHLCALLGELTPADQTRAASAIASWIDAYVAIDQAEDVGIEYFASAVVRVPEVRAAVPEDVIARAPNQMAGDTMASTQFTEMNYRLAHILSRLPEAERNRILDEVRATAADLIQSER